MPTGVYERQSLEDRFWSKVENSSGADCWQWLASTDPDGRGSFGITIDGKTSSERASRIAWSLRYGPIPEGAHVLHRCDNPGCCNPSHLFLGDNDINVADMVAKGRQAKGERNGMYGNGHLIAGEKNYMYGKGYLMAGENGPGHKLTSADIPLIKLLDIAGESRHVLAKRFGVHRITIGCVVREKSWRESDSDRHAFQQFCEALCVP